MPAAIWTVRKDGRRIECMMRFVPNGVEVQITSNGAPMYSRNFPTAAEALAWATVPNAITYRPSKSFS